MYCRLQLATEYLPAICLLLFVYANIGIYNLKGLAIGMLLYFHDVTKLLVFKHGVSIGYMHYHFKVTVDVKQ